MYLADRYPKAGLAPDTGADDRAFYNQWLFYLADTLYPTYNRLYHPERFSMDPADADRITERCQQMLVDQWNVVDRALAGHEWLVGSTCTTADIYMQMVSTWDQDTDGFRHRCPNVHRVTETVAARPAVAHALSRHVLVGRL